MDKTVNRFIKFTVSIKREMVIHMICFPQNKKGILKGTWKASNSQIDHTCWSTSECLHQPLIIRMMILVQWAYLSNMPVLFDAKDKSTFYSTQWSRDYNLEFFFLSTFNNGLLSASTIFLYTN